MKQLTVSAKSQVYPILIQSDSFAKAAKTIGRIVKAKTLFVITQKNIKALHGATLTKALQHWRLEWIVIPDGEMHKNLKTTEMILNELARRGANRESWLLGLGGGVVCDMTGFVASIFMRGIRFLQFPTTLLAQVDAAVGGKTGVDLKSGKNLAGTFKQPHGVFIQTDFLKTLPEREFAAGMAEVIKTALISSEKFCAFLLTNKKQILARNPKTLENMIFQSVKIKANIVAEDETEQNTRAILNYGHTLGHAIEALTHYKTFKHGEAVAMGLVFAAHLADRLQCAKVSTHTRVIELLESFNLPTAWPRFPKNRYEKFLRIDKKSGGQTIRFILPEKLGKVRIARLTIKEILRWL